MSQTLLDISNDGVVRFVWTDDLAGLLDEGAAAVTRASHVEPTPAGEWTADLSPSGGPTLGPFKLRGEAVAAEVAWIEANVIGEVQHGT